MNPLPKPVPLSVHADKPVPAALFKTSLRDWQARYQARRAAENLSESARPAPAPCSR